MRRFFITILYLCLNVIVLYATHNRAGEISFKWVSGLTYEVSITTYTYKPSLADRWELELFWGDGTSSILPRTNGPSGYNTYGYYCDHLGDTIGLGPDIKKNIYSGLHTYSGTATYIIYFEDPNRNGGIYNIPNSVNVPFYVESELIINPFLGVNNSPVLLNPPIDNACKGQVFYHNPGAYDIDGDSLSYSLINCKGESGNDIPGYFLPPATKILQINERTGDLTWDSPEYEGEYNIAIMIKEWRKGVKIGYMIRDMQITVYDCKNKPPYFKPIDDICVFANDTIDFSVIAIDPDNDLVTLTAQGGPFMTADNPATFKSVVRKDTASSRFYWDTNCDNIRKYPWQVTFRAVDNGKPINLVALKRINITIIAPPPEKLSVTIKGNVGFLKWEKPICPKVAGYKVYRNNDCNVLPKDPCRTGVPSGYGFILVGRTYNIDSLNFKDDNKENGLVPGFKYSYLVTAVMADSSESPPCKGNNKDSCITLKADIPIISKVSVGKTDVVSGVDTIMWTKPIKLVNPLDYGLYQYQILRSDINDHNWNIIHINKGFEDTIYIDTDINTRDKQYIYKVIFDSINSGNNYILGNTNTASSVFLSIKATDNQLNFSWKEQVPWQNDEYKIYRKKPGKDFFEYLTTQKGSSYEDRGLKNDEIYGYYVMSIGKYTQTGIVDSITNLSEIVYASALDTIRPCPPLIDITSNCCTLENIVTINNNNPENKDKYCLGNDIIGYNIYYKALENSDFVLLYSLNIVNNEITSYTHKLKNSIAGCYAVESVDTVGNKSIYSNIVCIDIDRCKLDTLPSVFVPNGNQPNNRFRLYNDVCKDSLFKYIYKINLNIYNRWGKLVYQTNEPLFQWDAKDMNSHNECSEGVYFYTCDFYMNSLKGNIIRKLKGSVTILKQ